MAGAPERVAGSGVPGGGDCGKAGAPCEGEAVGVVSCYYLLAPPRPRDPGAAKADCPAISLERAGESIPHCASLGPIRGKTWWRCSPCAPRSSGGCASTWVAHCHSPAQTSQRESPRRTRRNSRRFGSCAMQHATQGSDVDPSVVNLTSVLNSQPHIRHGPLQRLIPLPAPRICT